LASLTGQAYRAAVIFGALDRWCGWLKNVMSPAESDAYQQTLQSTRSTLGSENFQAAWAEGAALNLEQTSAYI